jgi:hypothetical protein
MARHGQEFGQKNSDRDRLLLRAVVAVVNAEFPGIIRAELLVAAL